MQTSPDSLWSFLLSWPLGFEQKPCRGVISSSLRDVMVAEATSRFPEATKFGVARLRQGYGTMENSRRRDENLRTDFARFRFGVRVSFPDDPLLALRSRPAFKEISVSLSQREMRKWAPSSARTCDICLGNARHVLFGYKTTKSHGNTEICHWLRSRAARWGFFFPLGDGLRPGQAQIHFHGCLSSVFSSEALLSNRRGVKMSFRSQLSETPTA